MSEFLASLGDGAVVAKRNPIKINRVPEGSVRLARSGEIFRLKWIN